MGRFTHALGEELEDERAANVVLFWNEAKQAFDAGKLETAEVRRNDALRELQRLESQLATSKSNTHRNNSLSLNTGGSRGTVVGMSNQAWLDRFSDEESGGIPSTPENRRKAKELWDQGLRPHALKT